MLSIISMIGIAAVAIFLFVFIAFLIKKFINSRKKYPNETISTQTIFKKIKSLAVKIAEDKEENKDKEENNKKTFKELFVQFAKNFFQKIEFCGAFTTSGNQHLNISLNINSIEDITKCDYNTYNFDSNCNGLNTFDYEYNDYSNKWKSSIDQINEEIESFNKLLKSLK